MKTIVSIAALIAASLPVAQADVITAWTFENNAIAVNNSPAPSTGSGTASSIGMATYATPSIGVTTDDVACGRCGRHGRERCCRSHPNLARPCAGRCWRRGSEWLVEPCAYRDAGRRVRRKHSGLQQHHCQLRLVCDESGRGEPATSIHHGWQHLAQCAAEPRRIRYRIGAHDQHHLRQYG